MKTPIQILLIEDEIEHKDLIQAHILRKRGDSVKLHWSNRLSDGLERLNQKDIDVILLDLGLPDSTIDKTLQKVLSKASNLPIVVLSSLDDEDFGMKAVHEGAQDYICKSRMDGESLFKSIRYAIERKSTEENLKQASRTKDEFLATISHELRTPIGVIQGFSELLNQGILSEKESQEGMEIILRNSKLLVTLINDLLDMSRIITGKLSLFTQVQSLVPIINDAIQAINLAVNSKHITLTTNFDPDIRNVCCDQVRIHQIMWNILSNSLKFTPEGGKIEIMLKAKESGAEIVVRDNGKGITADFLPYVFDRFRQQDNSMIRQHGGMGLGLSLVKYLTELHGGEVIIKSDGLGKGTTISVCLPYADEAKGKINSFQDAAEEKSSAIVSLDRTARSLKGLRILTVDDSQDTLALVSFVLKRAGAEVKIAESAAEARTIIHDSLLDLIVCDIGMPGEDGYAFLRSLRKADEDLGKKSTPAIALTAYTREEEKTAALQAGFQRHIAKPLNDTELIQAICELTSR
ncbi:MAG: response regulator [Bdellovibrionota bacterium]